MAARPTGDEFAREDLELHPSVHVTQARLAAGRGEGYDPYEFEELLSDPGGIEDLELVDGDPDSFEAWKRAALGNIEDESMDS